MIPGNTIRLIASVLFVLLTCWVIYSMYVVCSIIEEQFPTASSFSTVGKYWICVPFAVFLIGYIVKRILWFRRNARMMDVRLKLDVTRRTQKWNEINFTLALLFALISVRIIFALLIIITTPFVALGNPEESFWSFFF